MSSPNPYPNIGINPLNPFNRPSYVPFTDDQLKTLFKGMDSTKGLHSAGVIFGDRNLNFTELRASCRVDGKSIIIMERILVGNKAEAPPKDEGPESTMGGEVAGLALSCSSAVVSWLALVGEGAAAIPTVGATVAAMPFTSAVALASSAACGVSIGKVVNVSAGNAHYNDWIDDDPIFSGVLLFLDLVQLADVARTIVKLGPKLALFKGKTPKQAYTLYKNMTSVSRKQLALELLDISDGRLLKAQGAIKLALKAERQLATAQATLKTYHRMNLELLIKSGALDVIGAAITTAGSARPGSNGALDHLNKKSMKFLVGIIE